jgi:hypothetical protein
MSTYGEVMGVAALYWAAWARRNSDYHVLCVCTEPSGTEVLGPRQCLALYHDAKMKPVTAHWCLSFLDAGSQLC